MDYIPSKDVALIPWGKNLASEVTGANDTLKLPAADVALVIEASNTMSDKSDAATLAVAAAKKAVSEAREAKKAFIKAARVFAKQAKASTSYTDELGKRLGIYSVTASLDLTGYRPVITVRESGGHVQINFAKNGVHGLNIYDVDPVTAAVTLLGTAIQTPFVDRRGPKQSGIAQLNQYKAMAIEKNEEVGLWSEIVSISYKG